MRSVSNGSTWSATIEERGPRTGFHRVAGACPRIVPTLDMFGRVTAETARAYWHWYFLQQPAPYPEDVIAADPDHFYEGCLAGWGATRIGDFDPELLAEYRRTWRTRASIFGGCADYRAAAEVDVRLDEADLHRTVDCPALVFWGESGVIAGLFPVEEMWAPRLSRMHTASLPGGHFFVDQYPIEAAEILRDFLALAGESP